MNNELRIRNKNSCITNIIHSLLFILRKSKGFTLIELMVVIAIIGILASIILANIQGVRQRARDGQRKSDLRQIQAALEMYRADHAAYPTATNTPPVNCPVGVSPKTQIGDSACSIIYLKSVPKDPVGTIYPFNGGEYYYNSAGSTYTLAACLENTNDSQGVSATLQGSTGSCASNKFFLLQNP